MANLKDLLVTGPARIVGKVFSTGGFSGPGSELTSLNGSNISSGTVPYARLPVGTGSSQVAQGSHTHNYAGSSSAGGAANSATKATQDESGNNIKATYAAGISISDHTITLSNKNGVSLGTVTVPDNNTTYSSKAAASGGTDISLVTTGEKYIWNNKSSLTLGTTSSTAYRGDYGNAAYAHGVTNKGSAFSSGLYKITTNSEGHVTAATAVAKADITNLGISGTDTWIALVGATSSANGTAGYAPTPPKDGYNTKYLRADGTWSVPPDNNTTYSAGTGISLSGTTFSNSGVTGVKGNSESSYRTGQINITAANVGAVPTSRTVNNKALSSNITLTADDIAYNDWRTVKESIQTLSYNGDNYGECFTEANDPEKQVTLYATNIYGYNNIVMVKFYETNTAEEDLTLTVIPDDSVANNWTEITGYITDSLSNPLPRKDFLEAGKLYTFFYNFNTTCWELVGNVIVEPSDIGISDYVVEQGTSGDWKYCKWKSGKYECWLTGFSLSASTFASWAGGIYYHDYTSVKSFPVTFSSAPSVTLTSNESQAWIGGMWNTTTTNIGTIRCLSVNSTSKTPKINAYVVGTVSS